MTTHLADQERTRRRVPATAGELKGCESTALDISIARRPNRDPESGALSEADAALPQQLRRSLRASLTRWGIPNLVDDAELLLSELVTNALVHTDGPTVGIRVYVQNVRLKIEVNDFSPRGRLPRPAGPYAEHGRGLLIVDALADEWGVSEDRTTVWCTLPLTEGPSEMDPAAPPAQVLHESALPLTPNATAAGAARVSARTLLTIMAWPGPHHVAVDVLYVLVRNAVEHGLTEESAGRRLEAWLRINERRELLIDVQDHTPDFPSFDKAVRGELGRGLWGAQRLGAALSWFPGDQGKTVRATLQPGQVDL
ncbi:ATP-binding protein [Streptomyces sp. NPDC048350]|uniref:ATP-binding protein n=1 Tax=Streptomyces sp. NPDC048350 TaxID=3365538 RepID=UPI003720B0AE